MLRAFRIDAHDEMVMVAHQAICAEVDGEGFCQQLQAVEYPLAAVREGFTSDGIFATEVRAANTSIERGRVIRDLLKCPWELVRLRCRWRQLNRAAPTMSIRWVSQICLFFAIVQKLYFRGGAHCLILRRRPYMSQI